MNELIHGFQSWKNGLINEIMKGMHRLMYHVCMGGRRYGCYRHDTLKVNVFIVYVFMDVVILSKNDRTRKPRRGAGNGGGRAWGWGRRARRRANG